MPVKYAADFETTTKAPVRVWAWGAAQIDNPDIYDTGTNIESFFDWMQSVKNPVIYFHNERFDGSFILYYLLTHGYIWKRTKKDCGEKEFTTIIDDMGKFYAIEIFWKRKGKTVQKAIIYDSLKLIPMSVDDAAKEFGLKIQKLKIDYDRHNKNVPIKEQEWEYLEHDVKIMAQILQIAFKYELTKMTLASCSFGDFKKSFPRYSHYFPILPYAMDAEIRRAYRGGWTYANPDNSGFNVGRGIVFDVNSLYPSQMHDRLLPYGKPLYFRGQYKPVPMYPLYIQHLWAVFEIKPGHLPMIQIKHSTRFSPTEYLTSSKDKTGADQYVELWLPNPDLEIFLKHYEIKSIIYTDGYCFKGEKGIFEHWVDKWIDTKISAEKAGNKALRKIAKLMLNSCYGKFGTNPKRRSKKPVLDTKGNRLLFETIKTVCTDMYGHPIPKRNLNGDIVVNLETGEPVLLETDFELTKTKYIPIAVFITSWARYTTLTAAQAVHEKSLRETGKSRFCYADTDSIHLTGTEIPDCIEVDPYKLGAWKHESTFSRAKFLQAKRYVEAIESKAKHPMKPKKLRRSDCRFVYGYRGILNIKCAGLPDKCHDQVTFDNFEPGAVYIGKLVPKQVTGGVLLEETEFTLTVPKRKEKKCEKKQRKTRYG